MAESGGEPGLSRRGGRRALGEVWLRQRPRSWYWAAAFVVALVVVLVVLRLVEPVGPTAF
jgi:hypothetical protein